ncbi:hypothetical protein [Kitasatospora sp. NPDC059571]|uniref:hypothetical protein n=1 Tax=Kitasatospora sp. NPDC059571 TaxID=3346871 RepID=UPI0036C4D47D
MAAQRYRYVLALFGVLLLAALPLYLRPGHRCPADGLPCVAPEYAPGGILGPYELTRPGWLAGYWALALVAGGAALARHYRRAGLPYRALPVLAAAAATAGTTAVLTAVHWRGLRSPSAWAETAHLLVFNGASPLIVMAAALLALAAAERSPALAAFALAWAALAHTAATRDGLTTLGRLGLPLDPVDDPWGLRALPNIAVPALVLLAAALARPPAGRPPLSRPPGRRRRH